MRFTNIIIRGFRGFNEEQSLSLDRDVVIIYGLNGSGKSSLTEGLEWLFFGGISRQRLSRCRSDYQYEEYLRNLFYIGPGNPFVEVKGILKGKPITVKKELLKKGQVCYIDGITVPDFGRLGLNLANYFRPMLAQTEIKVLVDSEQKDRWEQLSSILGQDELTILREDLIKLKREKRDLEYKKQEGRYQSLLDDIERMPALAPLISPLSELKTDALVTEIGQITGVVSRSFQEFIPEIQTKQKSLLNTELGHRIAELNLGDGDKLLEFLGKLENGIGKLETLSVVATRDGYDLNHLDFLTKGMSIAAVPVCPFCGEHTFTDEKSKTINEILKAGEKAQDAITELKTLKNDIDISIANFYGSGKDYFPERRDLKIIAQKLLDIGELELARRIQNLDNTIAEIIEGSYNNLSKGKSDYFDYLDNKYFHNKPADDGSLRRLKGFIAGIITARHEVLVDWEDLKGDLTKTISVAGSAPEEQIKMWVILEKLCTFFASTYNFVKITKLLERLDAIQENLKAFEKRELERLLNKHAAEIKAYYEMLNPGDKIQFTGIAVKEGERRQAALKAEAFGKIMNPVTTFSEAHSNSLALSIYFPQRVDRNYTWETIILDDPVQSMDENHTQALIEIVAKVSENKQVIILTHSKSFYRRLIARFRYLKPLVYSFFYNDDSGPKISLTEGETPSLITKIREEVAKGDPLSLETASTLLRKSIESVCVEFLLDKGYSFKTVDNKKNAGLKDLLGEAEKGGFSPSDIGRLRSLLDITNPDSHAWSIADTTVGFLRSGMNTVNSIYDVYLK